MNGRMVFYGDDDLLHAGHVFEIERARDEDSELSSLEDEVVTAVLRRATDVGVLGFLGIFTVRRPHRGARAVRSE